MKRKLVSLLVMSIVLAGCTSQTGTKIKTQTTSKVDQKEQHTSNAEDEFVVMNGSDVILKDEKTLTGNIKVLRDFPINTLDRKRNIWIYLPPSYDSIDKKYPVLYMQDGQSIFKSNNTEWMVDETLEEFIKDKTTEETIVVGIESDPETRFDEYEPWKNPVGDGGDGDLYVDFIVKELKPYIDEQFHTLQDRENTSIAGGSMGGYISLYAALKYQEVFGKVAAFSPVFGFNKQPYIDYINEVKVHQDMQIYMDAGENEEEFPVADEDVKEIGELLVSVGLNQEKLNVVIDPEGTHSKDSWQKRFPDAFQWLMK